MTDNLIKFNKTIAVLSNSEIDNIVEHSVALLFSGENHVVISNSHIFKDDMYDIVVTKNSTGDKIKYGGITKNDISGFLTKLMSNPNIKNANVSIEIFKEE